MDEVKDKAKGIMKKLNPFSSSSRFKGEGHRLGSDPPPNSARRHIDQQQQLQQEEWKKSQQQRWEQQQQQLQSKQKHSKSHSNSSNPTSTSSTTTVITTKNSSPAPAVESPTPILSKQQVQEDILPDDPLATFLSSGPSEACVQVLLRLLANISKEPASAKFRRIRLANPKIVESIGTSACAMELLRSLGFTTVSEEGEDVCVMDEPSVHQLRSVDQAVAALEKHLSGSGAPAAKASDLLSEVRVFYASSQTSAVERAELPESFYELTLSEVKSLAASKRKQVDDSKLLVPKSFREKQAAAARQRYKFAVIRVQFPDNVLLQRVFLPKQSTSEIHSFVRSALKIEVPFELVDPVGGARGRLIADSQESSIEQANLLPSALLKFQTGSSEFSGLRADFLSRIEPLTSTPF